MDRLPLSSIGTLEDVSLDLESQRALQAQINNHKVRNSVRGGAISEASKGPLGKSQTLA